MINLTADLLCRTCYKSYNFKGEYIGKITTNTRTLPHYCQDNVVDKTSRVSYHGCSCSLGCHSCLIDLLLTGFDFGLQVRRRVKILALLSGTAALDVVHANSDGVVSGVNHWAVTGVSKAAICLPSCTVSPLKLAAHLRAAITETARGAQLLARGQIMSKQQNCANVC